MRSLWLLLLLVLSLSSAAAQQPTRTCSMIGQAVQCATVKGASTAPTAADNALTVTLSPNSAAQAVTTFDSGAVTATGVVNSSSHAAGTSVGGLISVPIARINGGSGIVTNFSWTSPGGSTGQLVMRIWQKNPSNTTCTDQSAYSGSATDDANLIVPPFSVTPATPANTTGDAKTYASVAGVTWDYKNSDTSPGQNLYVCAVTVSTDTADENSSVRVMLSGPQN